MKSEMKFDRNRRRKQIIQNTTTSLIFSDECTISFSLFSSLKSMNFVTIGLLFECMRVSRSRCLFILRHGANSANWKLFILLFFSPHTIFRPQFGFHRAIVRDAHERTAKWSVKKWKKKLFVLWLRAHRVENKERFAITCWSLFAQQTN